MFSFLASLSFEGNKPLIEGWEILTNYRVVNPYCINKKDGPGRDYGKFGHRINRVSRMKVKKLFDLSVLTVDHKKQNF